MSAGEVSSPMRIRVYDEADEAALIHLWTASGLTRPWNDPKLDIQRKLSEQPELFLVGEEDGALVATVMAGFDSHRGWIYYLAVDPARRGKGYGAQMVETAEALLRQRGCPKVNLMIRTDNADVQQFYSRLGYGQDAVMVMSKRLIADDS